jgi:hypothetical protein
MVRALLLMSVCALFVVGAVGCKGGVEVDPDMVSHVAL